MAGHVFIAYDRRDTDYVEKLAAHLTSAGVPVWFDREIATGARWENVIRDYIDTCAAFVVVMTPESEASDWVAREIALAQRHRKPILPLLLRGYAFFMLTDTQYEDVTGGHMPSTRFLARLRALVGADRDDTALGSAGHRGAAAAVSPVVGTLLREFHGDGGWVTSVAYLKDGRSIVAGWDEGSVRVLSGDGTRELCRGAGAVNAVAGSPDGRHIVVGEATGMVATWEPASGRRHRRFAAHEGAVRCATYSPDGRHVATGGDDHTVRMWDAGTGAAVRVLSGHHARVRAVAYSPDGRQLASCGDDETAHVWDIGRGRSVRTLSATRMLGRSSERDLLLAVAYRPDGDRIYCGSNNGLAYVWDTGRTRPLRIEGHSGPVWSVAVSPDGRHLATGSADQTVKLWDARTRSHLSTLVGHTGAVRAVAFSPDGRELATGGADGTVRVWRLSDERPAAGHTH